MNAKKKKLPKNIVRKGNSLYTRKSLVINGLRKQVWQSCAGTTNKEILASLILLDEKIERLQNPILNPPKPIRDKNSFRVIAERYAKAELTAPVYHGKQRVAGKKSSKNLRLKVDTAIDYFKDRSIADISFTDLQNYKLLRLRTPIKYKTMSRPRAIRTVNYELQTVRQILNFAVRERLLNRNPFQDGKGLIQPSLEKRRYVELSPHEEKIILESIPAERDYLKVLVIFFLDAGLRFGEAINLTWDQIDFNTNQINVLSFQTKTQKARSIPISQRLRLTLKNFQSSRATTANKLFKVKGVKRSWDTVRNSIERPGLHLHDLRHVFATKLMSKNVPLPVISQLLGHSSWKTTQIYVNPPLTALQNAIETLNC